MIFDPNEQISRYFKLKDLCVTQTGIDNTPDQTAYNYIKFTMAPALDELYDYIGPFKVISCFRNPQIQDKVETYKSNAKSFHEFGLASDIYPETMSIEIFFGKILADPYWQTIFYEIFLKPPQNTIHLSIDPQKRKPLIKVMNNDKSAYVLATQDQINKLIADAQNYDDSFMIQIADNPKTPQLAGGAILGLSVLMMMAPQFKNTKILGIPSIPLIISLCATAFVGYKWYMKRPLEI